MKTKKIVCILFAIIVCNSMKALTISGVSAPSTVSMYEIYEVSFSISTLPATTNPYDAQQIDVYGDFISPSGIHYKQNGFFFRAVSAVHNSRPVETPLPGNTTLGIAPFQYTEELTTDFFRPGTWKIRFATNETGTWQFKIYVNDVVGGVVVPYPSSSSLNFNSTSALADNHGFISAANRKYLKFTDGTPFYPLGYSYIASQGAGFAKQECGTSEIVQVMDQMAAKGMNFFRIEVNFPEGINLIGKDVGQQTTPCYTYFRYFNQGNAWQLDQVINYARSKGIYLELSLIASSMFADLMGGHPFNHWSDVNPFDANITVPPTWSDSHDALGTCTSPYDFFTNADAVAVTKNLFRYIVARWGYSTNVMSYELLDEWSGLQGMNSPTATYPTYDPCFPGTSTPWPDATGLPTKISNWHITMKNFIASVDPFKHLVTAANGPQSISEPAVSDIFNAMDFSQTHNYNDYDYSASATADNLTFLDANGAHYHDAQEAFSGDALAYTSNFLKPYMTGESYYFAWVAGDWTTSFMHTYDPHMYDMHCSLWSSMFNGSMGTASYWEHTFFYNINNDFSILSNYTGINAFTKALPQLSEKFKPEKNLNVNNNFRTYYLKNINSDKIYGWAQDINFNMNIIWHNYRAYLTTFAAGSRPATGSNNNIDFTVSKNGSYTVKWFNTETGALVSTSTVVSTANLVTITMPASLRAGHYADGGYMIEYICAGQWNAGPLYDAAPANARAHSPIVTRSNQVNYIGSDNMVHQYYRASYFWEGNGAIVSTPANIRSDSDLGIDNSGGIIYYVGSDNKLHRYYYAGTSWMLEGLAGSAADFRANTPLVVDALSRVYYIASDNKIHWYNGSFTQPLNSTAPANVALNSALAIDASNRIFFTGTDYRIHKMELISGVWQESTLNTSAPANVRVQTWATTPKPASSSLAVDPVSNNAVYFVATDNKIHQMKLISGVWQESALQPAALGSVRLVNPDFDFRNSLSCDNSGNIYYVASDNKIHRYYNSGGTWTETINNTADAANVTGGIIADLTGPRVYFITNTSKVWASYWDCDPLFKSLHEDEENNDEKETVNNNLELLIYPNPANDLVNVKLSTPQKIDKINLIDFSGNIIFTKNDIEGIEFQINTSSISNGIYLLQVFTGEKNYFKKIEIIK